MFKVNNKNTKKTSLKNVVVSSLLTLNYFTPFPTFPIVYFKQVNVCRENYLIFYSLDIFFNVSTGGMQDSTRSNEENSVIFLILNTQWDITLASFPFFK